jgi:acyl carrier protein
MEKLKNAVLAVFPEIKTETIEPGLKLGNIPGWDSMNSINLQIELEKQFNLDLSDTQLGEEQTLSQVTDIIKNKGGRV